MGKANFTQIYQDATDALGERPRIKVSYWCNKFRKDANYAGFIVYHTYGSFEWKQREGQGLSGGHRGRSFYVLLLCALTLLSYLVALPAACAVSTMPMQQRCVCLRCLRVRIA